MPALPFPNPIQTSPSSDSTSGGGFSGPTCPPIITISNICGQISRVSCSCVNSGPKNPISPAGWETIEVGEEGSGGYTGGGTYPNGGTTLNPTTQTVTLGGGPSSWSPPYYSYTGYMELRLNCSDGSYHVIDTWNTQAGGPSRNLISQTTNPCGASSPPPNLGDKDTPEKCSQAASANSSYNISWNCQTFLEDSCTEKTDIVYREDANSDLANMLDQIKAFFVSSKTSEITPEVRKQLTITRLRNTITLGGHLAADAIKSVIAQIDSIVDAEGKIIVNSRNLYNLNIPNGGDNITTLFGTMSKKDYIIQLLKAADKSVTNTINAGGKPLRDLLEASGKSNLTGPTVEGLDKASILRKRALARKAGKIGGVILAIGQISDALADGDLTADDILNLLKAGLPTAPECVVSDPSKPREVDPDVQWLMDQVDQLNDYNDPYSKPPKSLDDTIDEFLGPDRNGPFRSQFFIPRPNSQNGNVLDGSIPTPSIIYNNNLLNNNMGFPSISFPSVSIPKSPDDDIIIIDDPGWDRSPVITSPGFPSPPESEPIYYPFRQN